MILAAQEVVGQQREQHRGGEGAREAHLQPAQDEEGRQRREREGEQVEEVERDDRIPHDDTDRAHECKLHVVAGEDGKVVELLPARRAELVVLPERALLDRVLDDSRGEGGVARVVEGHAQVGVPDLEHEAGAEQGKGRRERREQRVGARDADTMPRCYGPSER